MPATIADYIAAAPPQARPHLERLLVILTEAAPHAEPCIKWNTPFFVEPRFVYAFSAAKSHCNFAPSPAILGVFADELATHRTTANYLQLPYAKPLPEGLIRRMAEHRVRVLLEREDDAFWDPS